jgi:hypothetical protein
MSACLRHLSPPGVPRSPRASVRGVASVEAVIVLPIFVLLFVGVTYFAKLALAKGDAEAEARRCAWLYSMNNCQEVPAGCALPADAPPGASNPLVTALASGGKALEQNSSDLVAKIVTPLLGKAINEALGGSRVARASRTIERPPLFGGNTTTIAREYRLACNLAPESAGSVADKAWKLFRP